MAARRGSTIKGMALTLGMAVSGCAYESAFEMSPVGEVHIKDIPAAKLLRTEGEQSYFTESGTMFSELFDYIKENQVSMTVPVEGGVTEKSYMAFFVGSADASKDLKNNDSVSVIERPARKVASIGGKGAYTRVNLRAKQKELQAWLAEHPEWTTVGDPYGVFWHDPFTPDSVKRFELQVEVKSTEKKDGGDTMAELTSGAKAPAFKLKNQDDEWVSLKDYKGRKLLLYFYPKADTPGCTVQSCAVRDALEPLKEAGVDAIGISPDPPAKQKKFDEKYSLGFPLLADEDHAVAEAYGVWGEKKMYGKSYQGIVRSAFLIDESGKVIDAWYKVSPKETVPKAQAALQ